MLWMKASLLALGLLLAASCKDKQPEAVPSAAVAVPEAPSAAVAGPGAPQGATSAGSCPEGRWRYDYSDQALEVMMKNAAGAKVLKEEGEFICVVSSGQQGIITCDSGGKPVVNVVETKQMGLAMTISVEITGKATTKFTLVDGSHMKVVASDTSQLKIKANVKLGGKDIPFPTDKLLTIFGEPESTLAYKCDGGALAIKPELTNVETDWQKFTPVK